MHKIRIGGVPEHFNYPWHLAMQEKLFQKIGVEVEWLTFKEGTGAMTQALRNDEVDFCVLLTEGIIKDIVAGNPSKIISHYVNSPLTWGIFSGAMNPISSTEIFNKKIAISRYGSGSHLMPQIHSKEEGQLIFSDQFEVINNLDGAIESLTNLKTDVFYWENFTTKPYVDKGVFKKVSEYKPPWPCFVIAGREDSIKKFESQIQSVLHQVYKVAEEFRQSNGKVDVISDKYLIQKSDVKEWFEQLEWSSETKVDKKMIEKLLNLLKSCEMIEKDSNVNLEQLIYEFE